MHRLTDSIETQASPATRALSADDLMAVDLPAPRKRRRWVRWTFGGLLLAGIVGVGVWMRFFQTTAPTGPDLRYFAVRPMDLEVRVSKDGELYAVRNIEIVSQVEGVTTIQFIEKEGTVVEKDAVVARLDSADIRKKLEDVTLEVQTAEAELTVAKEMADIQKSQNEANLDAARVGLTLAELDLKQYLEGKYPQDLASAKIAVDMAEITLRNKQDDFEQTQKLFAKGFVTMTDIKKGELEVLNARNELSKSQTALRVLTEYANKKDAASYENALAQAKAKLARTEREAASQMAQRMADVRAKQQRFDVQRKRMAHLKQQEEYCTVRAPEAGLVVYGSTSSGGRGSETRLIEEGAQVRERQPLLRLPDVRQMKAVIRVQESQAHILEPMSRREKEEDKVKAIVRIDGYPHPIAGTLTKVSPMPDSTQWWNPDLKEYSVDVTLDHTPPNMKPRRGARVEVLIERLPGVLAAPVGAIYASGGSSFVFLRRDQGGPTPRKVKLGASNETHVELREGVAADEQVLLLTPGQGRELLEKAGIKSEPETRPSGGKGSGGKRRDRSSGGERSKGP